MIVFLVWEYLYLLVSPLFLVCVLLCYWKNIQTAKERSRVFSLPLDGVGLKTLRSVFLGIVAGCLVSALVICLGIDVYTLGLEYLWLIMLLLAFVHLRLLCFSYGGGIAVALAALDLIEINEGGLIAMVGILHLAEGVLVWAEGNKLKQVVFIKRKGKIEAEFLVQNIWPIPLLMMGMENGIVNEIWEYTMPLWWPLYAQNSTDIFVLLPILAVLGYSDVTENRNVKKKTLWNGCGLIAYGCILLVLAYGIKCGYVSVLTGALLMPLLHEAVMGVNRFIDRKSVQKTEDCDEGVLVLDLTEAAKKAGIKTGDRILMIDNEKVGSRTEIKMALVAKEEVRILYKRKNKDRITFCKNLQGFDIVTTACKEITYEADSGWFYMPKKIMELGRYLWEKMRQVK